MVKTSFSKKVDFSTYLGCVWVVHHFSRTKRWWARGIETSIDPCWVNWPKAFLASATALFLPEMNTSIAPFLRWYSIWHLVSFIILTHSPSHFSRGTLFKGFLFLCNFWKILKLELPIKVSKPFEVSQNVPKAGNFLCYLKQFWNLQKQTFEDFLDLQRVWKIQLKFQI